MKKIHDIFLRNICLTTLGLISVLALVSPDNITASETVILSPSADSYVNSINNTNSYDNTELLTGRVSSGDYRRSYLTFDLSEVPNDAYITSVSLDLYINSNDTAHRHYRYKNL